MGQRAVTLNDRVALEQRSASVDSIGQPVETWTTLATVWADVRELSGLETLKAGAETSVVRASIRIRRRSGVTNALRAKHGSTTYDIEAVLESATDFLDLVCKRAT